MTMRILDLTFKDLAQILRDKRSLLFLVAMPILFTLFMGFAYRGGGNDTVVDARIALGWVNNDPDGLLSRQLHEMLVNSGNFKLVELTPEAVNKTIHKGDVTGALIVPEGFSVGLTGSPTQLTLVADTTSAQGQSLYQLLRTTITRLMSAAEIARLGTETTGKAGDASELEAGFSLAARAWSETDSASLIKVEMAIAKQEAAWYGDNPYNQASPGILVQFAIFGLVSSGQILVQERKTRTLQRMMSTSMRAWEIVAGHLLAMFAIVFLQETLLVVFGQLALGVNYAHEPLGTLLISVGLALWIAAMGLLIGVLAKDDSQVILYSLMAMFLFSAMGGTWFPLEASSGGFAVIGKLMPSAWAMNGYQNILIRGLGVGSAYLPALILLAYALGFFGLAVWRFRKMSI
jgi:ABC-2 type transport system permease protein